MHQQQLVRNQSTFPCLETLLDRFLRLHHPSLLPVLQTLLHRRRRLKVRYLVLCFQFLICSMWKSGSSSGFSVLGLQLIQVLMLNFDIEFRGFIQSIYASVWKYKSRDHERNASMSYLPFSFYISEVALPFTSLKFSNMGNPLLFSQIPARTNSAPPNLDEQKRDQVCHFHDCKQFLLLNVYRLCGSQFLFVGLLFYVFFSPCACYCIFYYLWLKLGCSLNLESE